VKKQHTNYLKHIYGMRSISNKQKLTILDTIFQKNENIIRKKCNSMAQKYKQKCPSFRLEIIKIQKLVSNFCRVVV